MGLEEMSGDEDADVVVVGTVNPPFFSLFSATRIKVWNLPMGQFCSMQCEVLYWHQAPPTASHTA